MPAEDGKDVGRTNDVPILFLYCQHIRPVFKQQMCKAA